MLRTKYVKIFNFNIPLLITSICKEKVLFSNNLIYPNPTKDKLYISEKLKVVSYKVFNVMGENVIEMGVSSTPLQIDVSKLTKGIYFIKIYSNDKTFNYKFVKQ